ncbi:glycosyl transferase family 2 [Lederbergia ruris]|uniref:Glycosyl transferase family 2 n=1 Tax=Lederbergia ruris TaxID=217495 RepID=A0ABQ4KND8_9BACI|nr:glycosyltransferase family 2 protein [Lederbergia ruris]GIN58832.1 glycosyl transferase family 2 [Lederbergia ruris]
MVKISVVMPVYNSEDFLQEAVQSILEQTFTDFELILVNDASNDNSGKLCDKLSGNDSRIRVIHHDTNGGICAARNSGLNIAKGEYIAFCDDDDFYSQDLLEANYTLAKEFNADMVKFGRKLVDVLDNGEVVRERETNIPELLVYKDAELKTNYFFIRSFGTLINVWNGLYRTRMIRDNGIKFDEEMKFGSEDADFTMRAFLNTKVLVLNPNICYTHFRRNASSTSRKFNLNKVDSLISTAKTEERIWRKLDQTKENNIEIICTINKYIMSIITYQLLHKDCNLNKEEKIQLISSLRENSHLHYKLDNKCLMEIFRKSPSQALFTFLYGNGKSKLLLNMLKLNNSLFGEKW